MTKEIKKVGVIGAGTMGAGIAGQLANAGVEVVLLDLKDDEGNNKADLAIERMKKAKPTDAFNAGLMIPENAKYITTGLSNENLDMLADCDWIIETILAPQKIRENIYSNVEKIAKKDATVTCWELISTPSTLYSKERGDRALSNARSFRSKKRTT